MKAERLVDAILTPSFVTWEVVICLDSRIAHTDVGSIERRHHEGKLISVEYMVMHNVVYPTRLRAQVGR